MTHNYTLQLNQLRAGRLIAPKKAICDYLNGVYLDSTGYAVATDERIMLVQRCTVTDNAPSAIMPNAMIDLILAAHKKHASCTEIAVEVSVSPDNAVKLTCGDVAARGLGGPYPQWKQVLPKTADTESSDLIAVDYVVKAQKVLRLLNDTGNKSYATIKLLKAADQAHSANVVSGTPEGSILIVVSLRETRKPEALASLAAAIKTTLNGIHGVTS